MKKILGVCMALVMMLSFVACKSEKEKQYERATRELEEAQREMAELEREIEYAEGLQEDLENAYSK